MGDGPQICQKVGEPYNNVLYIECLKCNLKTCPINKVFDILRRIAPYTLAEIEKEET